MSEEKFNQLEIDRLVSEIENHQFDIDRHVKLKDEKQVIIDAARKHGYKLPLERLEEEVAKNALEKKRREESVLKQTSVKSKKQSAEV